MTDEYEAMELLPPTIRRAIQESDIIGGLGLCAIEVYILYQALGEARTLDLMAARDAMEAARRPTVVGPGATLASRQGVTRVQSTPPMGCGVKKSTP